MSTGSEVTAPEERENFIARLADALGSRANAATVFGEPIVREHTTVVPVASARWGCGGGGGRRAGQPSDVLNGFGGGGGMMVNPVGYLVIRDAGVEYHAIGGTMRVVTAIAAGLLLGVIFQRLARRK